MEDVLCVAMLSKNRKAKKIVLRILEMTDHKKERLMFIKKQYEDAENEADKEMDIEFKKLFQACSKDMPQDATFETYSIGFNIDSNWVSISKKSTVQK